MTTLSFAEPAVVPPDIPPPLGIATLPEFPPPPDALPTPGTSVPPEPPPRLADAPAAADDEPALVPGFARLFDLVLKDGARLDRLARHRALQTALMTRLLALALAGFALYGLAAGIAATAASPSPALAAWAPHGARHILPLTLAYTLGLVAAIGICLPSFYFYNLLAGIRASMLETAVHAVKTLAVTAVALVGFLPLALALVLSASLLGFGSEAWDLALIVLLVLPFLAGLLGLRALYHGIMRLAADAAGGARSPRACFARRLVSAWVGVYLAVSPLMIFTLWNAFRA